MLLSVIFFFSYHSFLPYVFFFRYAAEEQKNYEYSQEARQNYEHGKSVREKLTGNAHKGASEVFSTSKSVQLQKQQQSPARNENFDYGSKENYQSSQQNNYSSSPQLQINNQNNYNQQYDNQQQYDDDYSQQTGRSESCHDKYEAMLRSAAQKRVQDKLSPRSTNFY